MALTPGTRLGVYEIAAQIGEGGMGQVYRATDRNLKRSVAIKVLPAAVAGDADRLARFRREAEVLASLNHPNIAAIYGLEKTENFTALVMELVEGDDLSQRIARGALPLDEALPIAKQIADAIEAAHEQGIIHRDLKPANIKVRADGTVKVLDFGLAKAMDPAAGSSPGLSTSPTVSVHATQAGVILGTAAYMSPEQASGKRVDKRSDLWSLGVVVLEMLTGQPVFTGDTVSDVLASVLKSDPDWTRLPATTPAALRRLLRRCLEKDRKRRLDSAADARLEIEEAIAAPTALESGVGASAPASEPRGRPAWMTALAAVAILGVMVAMAVPTLRHLRETPPSEPPVTRFTMALPDGVTLTSAPMISPDGTRVVFAGVGALYVRPLDALTAQRLPATEGASTPFWSPDSKSVGFFAGGKLKRIEIAGGPAVTICDVSSGASGSWSTKGLIVFSPNTTSGLQQVSAAGGTPTPATILDPATKAIAHRWPHFLPDGEHFLYLNVAAPGATGIFVTSLGSPTSTPLVSTDRRAQDALPGALLFVRGTTLMRQPFDTAEFRMTGEAVPVAEDIASSEASDAAFSVSHSGVLVYATGQAVPNRRLVWVDRRGVTSPLALAPGVYADPALSPDGRQIALTVRDQTGFHIWVYDIARATLSKRTFEGESNIQPIWTPEGTFLTFRRLLVGADVVMRVRADGSGTAEPLVTAAQLPGVKVPSSWSADGRFLAIQNTPNVVVRDADGVLHPTLTTGSTHREARFAPDGQWLAYRSNETGRWEIYVQPYPPGRGKWQISTDGGAQPMWAPNGRELFYQNGNRVMAVDVALGTAFKAGTPRALFEMPLPERNVDNPARYAVASDAQRFLVLTTVPGEKTAAPPLTVVLNYARTLKH